MKSKRRYLPHTVRHVNSARIAEDVVSSSGDGDDIGIIESMKLHREHVPDIRVKLRLIVALVLASVGEILRSRHFH